VTEGLNLLTLDRLGRNMRETLNLVHDLTQRGIFLRTLGDKLAVDTSDPGPGTDMAVALLAMFAQMERICFPWTYAWINSPSPLRSACGDQECLTTNRCGN
jgi:hypothetical protein